jgi:hypothetical protein
MVPLLKAGAGRYSDRFLRAIDHALAVRPDDRPHSAAEMRAELGVEERRSRARKSNRIPTAPMPLEGTVSAADGATVPPIRPLPALKPLLRPPHGEPEAMRPQRQAQRTTARAVIGLLVAALAVTATVGLGWWWWSSDASSGAEPQTAGAPAGTPAANPERSPALPAASAAVDTMPSELTQHAPAESVEPPAASIAPVTAPPPLAPAATAEPTAHERSPASGVSTRSAPRKNSPNARCTDIIARVSLGEELSAQDHATLERECRK